MAGSERGRLFAMKPLLPDDIAQLTRLEEAMWTEATRFDESFMQDSLAADFFEFGSSGRMYTRDATLNTTRQVIGASLPLQELVIRLLDDNTAQVTYISETSATGGPRRARRSSIWSKTSTGWQLRFHQGTPIQDHQDVAPGRSP
jgi:hypothetical protein